MKSKPNCDTLNKVISLHFFVKFNFPEIYLQYQMNGNIIYIAGCYGYAIIIITLTYASAPPLHCILWRAIHKQLTIVRILRAPQEEWPIF